MDADGILNYVYLIGALFIVGSLVGGFYGVSSASPVSLFIAGIIFDISLFFLSVIKFPIKDPIFGALFGMVGAIFGYWVVGGLPGLAVGAIIFINAFLVDLPLATVSIFLFRYAAVTIAGWF